MNNLLIPMLLTAATSFSLKAQEAGFVPLFPKEGVPAGWTTQHWADVAKPAEGHPVWTVKEGTLTSSGDRGCWFISGKEYGDFTLKYEFRLGPRGNSGLALRAPDKGDPAFDGMELQMADFRYNTEAKPSELTGGIYRAVAPLEQVYKPEEWNRMEVTLAGTRLTATLNGTKIQDVDLAKKTAPVLRHDNTEAPPLKDRPLKGKIGFQNLSRDGGQVEIRGAMIREGKP